MTDGYAFSPQFLTIEVGDSVVFLNRGGYHNVVADDGSFRCAHGCDGDGHGGSGNPSASFWTATVAFNDAGTIGYFCEPHGSPGGGMYGSIDVVAPTPPEPVPGGGIDSASIAAALLCAAAILELRRMRRRD